MIHLGRLSIVGSGIVFGGVTLGAVLAAFVNPLPKAAEPPPWRQMLYPQVAVGDVQPYNSMPEDLAPPSMPDGYAPAIAYTELRWPVGGEPREREEPAVRAPLPATADRTAAPDYADQADRPVSVPHYAAIEQAALDEQRSLGGKADSGSGAGEEPPAQAVRIDPAGGARVIHIDDAG
ncbi:MAG: hypothetical protein ABIP41_09435 [Croceibacterium sp.]